MNGTMYRLWHSNIALPPVKILCRIIVYIGGVLHLCNAVSFSFMFESLAGSHMHTTKSEYKDVISAVHSTLYDLLIFTKTNDFHTSRLTKLARIMEGEKKWQI